MNGVERSAFAFDGSSIGTSMRSSFVSGICSDAMIALPSGSQLISPTPKMPSEPTLRWALPSGAMVITVDSTINGGRGAIIPVTDDGTYDFFVVITLDGDDRGDYFLPGAREPNLSNDEQGIIFLDYEGVRPGDNFMVSLARGSTPLMGGAIFTDVGYPNASEVTKPGH